MLSEICRERWAPESHHQSIIEERGKSEELESSQPMLHSSSSTVHAAAPARVWQSLSQAIKGEVKKKETTP